MELPEDYLERVYAGVLGKIIGVYLGRPFEGWTYDQIMAELGEIRFYMHEKMNKLLVVPDDDISGTFTFIRALPDYGNRQDITPAQIGQTWLNYLIEGRTILWWGGRGNSTEHTAYLNLKDSITAPRSGSSALNGRVVAEQIGAQIFIDSWAMVAPGNPELAADLARRAASVSHDGEAVYAAQLLAAMESLAFVENNLDTLLDTGLRFIPSSSMIFRLVQDLRDWRAAQADWRKTRARIASQYGYNRYPGNCHVIPNHALIHLALLYGDSDFQTSLMIVNTSGWDTDCNSGNVGCLLGIKNGLAGFESGPDWRSPVADRMYISNADGGRSITDALTEAFEIANIGRALAGRHPIVPKGGAKFHFSLPGSTMGFHSIESGNRGSVLQIENASEPTALNNRCLVLRFPHLEPGQVARAFTPTFITPEAALIPGPYSLQASPTLYPGQTIHAKVNADLQNNCSVICNLVLKSYNPQDALQEIWGPSIKLEPGGEGTIEWRVPDQEGAPIVEVGLGISSLQQADGTIYLDYLTWEGSPDFVLTRPVSGGAMWRRAWVDGVDHFLPWTWSADHFRLVQNQGRGLLIQGSCKWDNYQVSTTLIPQLVSQAGIAVCVQGMRRYYALLLDRCQKARLIKVLDGEKMLDEADFSWDFYQPTRIRLQVEGNHLRGWLDDELFFDRWDNEPLLNGGGFALVCEAGCMSCGPVQIRPASEQP
jgi:ADP-ribosylglycohydrolase